MASTEGRKLARVSKSHKAGRSPDWSLQLDSMELESLVIVNQNVTVNTSPGLVHTARHTMGVGCKEVGSLTFGRTLTILWFMTGVKS